MSKNEHRYRFFRATNAVRQDAKGALPQWKIERLTNMHSEAACNFSPAYTAWFGKPVVLLVFIRQCCVPVSCRIVGESIAEVRIWIQPGWELEVRKELILAVEEDRQAPDAGVN